MNAKTAGMLGLAMKAGKAASGGFQTEKSIRKRMSHLVIISEDASEGTRKKFSRMCEHYGIPVIIAGDKASLGAALGKEERSVISVNDGNFAGAICELEA